MMKRLVDITVSLSVLVILSPFLLLAAIGIKLSSAGPIMYRTTRVGLYGREFVMQKFRTMHVIKDRGSSITGNRDYRVFFVGGLLRLTKIDELPQLWNVIKGEMSLVGPRPEDPAIVAKFYAPGDRITLDVLPGLASPGSIFNYTHGRLFIDDAAPEESYAKGLLPLKLAMDLHYVQNHTWIYDVEIVFRTAFVILLVLLGRRKFGFPREYQWAVARLEKTRR